MWGERVCHSQQPRSCLFLLSNKDPRIKDWEWSLQVDRTWAVSALGVWQELSPGTFPLARCRLATTKQEFYKGWGVTTRNFSPRERTCVSYITAPIFLVPIIWANHLISPDLAVFVYIKGKKKWFCFLFSFSNINSNSRRKVKSILFTFILSFWKVKHFYLLVSYVI
jgi:hypothetical protein